MAISVNRKIGTPAVRFQTDFYKRAYNQYRQGVFRELIEMMNRAETDTQVNGCLMGRRAGFQRDFMVAAFSDETADQERAEWVRNVILNLEHRTLFKNIQEAQLKKFSVIDFEWDVIDNRQIPVAHEQLDHKYFKFDPKDGILKIDFSNRLDEIPADEALLCITSEMPVLLPVLRDYILKEFGLESWAGFIETFGEPMVIGKYPPGADATFKDEVETAVKAIARSSRGTMPEGTNLEIIETNRSAGDHEKFVDVSNRGICITILGHANAVQQSQGLQVGENLTQYKVKREIAVDDMYFIDNCMQRFVRMLIARNFGDTKYPVFSFDKKDPLDPKTKMDIVDMAWNHGLTIDPDEYRDLGLRVEPQQEPITKQGPF